MKVVQITTVSSLYSRIVLQDVQMVQNIIVILLNAIMKLVMIEQFIIVMVLHGKPVISLVEIIMETVLRLEILRC